MEKIIARLWVLLATTWVLQAQEAARPFVPLLRAHSHNDYEHERPLFDALDQGFCSIEADIYLVNGELLVAHERNQVRPERTLQKLYLDPLRDRIKNNGGQVFRGVPTIVLLIDVKTEAEPTYLKLREVLRHYDNILTKFSRGTIQTNAVTAVISGNRAPKILEQEPLRLAALDGRPEDLDGSSPAELIPLISESWTKLFQWRGQGTLPEKEKHQLLSLVQRAHAQGRKVRFWATADTTAFWSVLDENGVDIINADDLKALRGYFLSNRSPRH